MHLLDEEELAHVGRILKLGYVREPKPKKKRRVKVILFCVLFSLLALLFLALSVYCIYWVVNGLHLIVAFPGFIISAAFCGLSLREIHLSLDNYVPPFESKVYRKSPPNFFLDPDAEADLISRQSTASSHNQSLHNFEPAEATSIFKSTADNEVVKDSTSEESVQLGKATKIIRSVSQYEDNVPNQEQLIVKSVAESSFSSSRKRFSHNFESEEGLVEKKTLPFVESFPAGSKEVGEVLEKGSFQSLPAIKLMSNSDT